MSPLPEDVPRFADVRQIRFSRRIAFRRAPLPRGIPFRPHPSAHLVVRAAEVVEDEGGVRFVASLRAIATISRTVSRPQQSSSGSGTEARLLTVSATFLWSVPGPSSDRDRPLVEARIRPAVGVLEDQRQRVQGFSRLDALDPREDSGITPCGQSFRPRDPACSKGQCQGALGATKRSSRSPKDAAFSAARS